MLFAKYSLWIQEANLLIYIFNSLSFAFNMQLLISKFLYQSINHRVVSFFSFLCVNYMVRRGEVAHMHAIVTSSEGL